MSRSCDESAHASASAFAMIDLVAHLYRGSRSARAELAKIWETYTRASASERARSGFEMVRMHHATLTRIFRDGAPRDARTRE